MHFAYLDPGTGSLVLQAVIGVILGGVVVFRGFIFKIVNKFRPSSSSKTITDEE
jgi:hypothetical protein